MTRGGNKRRIMMDPYALAQRMLLHIQDDDIFAAADHAVDLLEWQRKGGFVGIMIVNEVHRSIELLDMLDLDDLGKQLYGLLNKFIAVYLNDKPNTGPIVEDYASIAHGLRNLRRSK